VATVIEAYQELVTSVTNPVVTAVTAPKRNRAEYMRRYRAKKAAATPGPPMTLGSKRELGGASLHKVDRC
jgi:hypothetical protein